MKFLVTGCGSIGRRHIKNLIALGHEVIGHDVAREGREAASSLLGIRACADLTEALAARPDAVIVATPTSMHVGPALEAAKAGCAICVEKPISHTAEGLDELVSVVRSKGLVTLVGCNMRFHPGIRKVKGLLDAGAIGRVLSADIEAGSYLPGWRPSIDYRKNYSACREMGGGIILDSIHEIDYARWMLGDVSTVACFAGKISSLELDVEDAAEILLKFTSGALGRIRLDYFQRPSSRRCKIIGENGMITWSLAEARVGHYSADSAQWSWFAQPEGYDLNEMYIDELKHFISCLEGKEKSVHDISEGMADLRIALASKESSLNRKFIELA